MDIANHSGRLRLFHVSEAPGLKTFDPRPVSSPDSGVAGEAVWAIDEIHLPNYLLPRDCTRVAFRISEKTTDGDKKRFFLSSLASHVIALESDWMARIEACRLHVYEFSPTRFELADAGAGYYVSRSVETAISSLTICDVLSEVRKRNVEVRFMQDLWALRDDVVESSLEFSIIRFRNAQPKG